MSQDKKLACAVEECDIGSNQPFSCHQWELPNGPVRSQDVHWKNRYFIGQRHVAWFGFDVERSECTADLERRAGRLRRSRILFGGRVQVDRLMDHCRNSVLAQGSRQTSVRNVLVRVQFHASGGVASDQIALTVQGRPRPYLPNVRKLSHP